MHISLAIGLIRYGVGLTMVLYGIDQLRNPLPWVQQYMPQWLIKILPTKPETEMRFHAAGNLLFGLFLIFTFGFTLTSAWVAFVWWITILPFAFYHKWDIGMRDFSIILSLAALLAILYS